MTAEDVIRTLGLERHREGGAFRETFRDPAADADGRPRSTAIYYLLKAGERSHWHRIDAAEIWHHYAGAPLTLRISEDGRRSTAWVLGDDLAAGQHPQRAIPAGAWQSAASRGAWSLVGCTVAPGFSFDGFELAPAGWAPSEDDEERDP